MFALYVILALGLLAPIASDTILPSAPDHGNHTAYIVEARRALEEGQFPLRIAPFAQNGLRYPLFQFYSQTPYLIAGGIHKYVSPENPWRALKMSYFAGLCLAAFFVFKVCELLGFDRAISALTGVVYITAPYLLINIHARGAYTEAFAQFVIPPLAFFSIRLIRSRRPVDLLMTSSFWFILGTSHLITFMYATLFYLLLVACLLTCRCINLRNAALLVAVCFLGWGLSAFQWYPAATIAPMRIHAIMAGASMSDWTWLTPLSTLLSLTSNPPEPLGGTRLTTPFLHPAIGVPIVVAVAGVAYLGRFREERLAPVWVCLGLFVVAFLGTWSPVDVWNRLPAQLQVIQFTYRLLTFTTVFGTIVFAYFLSAYQHRYGSPGFLPTIVALVLLAGPYLPVLTRSARSLSSIEATPEANYFANAYEFVGEVPPIGIDTFRRYPEVQPHCGIKQAAVTCDLDGPAFVQLPMLFYPSVLKVTVNGKAVRYRPSVDGDRRLVSVLLQPGKNLVVSRFAGSVVGNAASLVSAALVLVFFSVCSVWTKRNSRHAI